MREEIESIILNDLNSINTSEKNIQNRIEEKINNQNRIIEKERKTKLFLEQHNKNKIEELTEEEKKQLNELIEKE